MPAAEEVGLGAQRPGVSYAGGVRAERCDDVRPDLLEILRQMDVAGPVEATNSELIAASTQRALDGFTRYEVGTPVPRGDQGGKTIRARWDRV